MFANLSFCRTIRMMRYYCGASLILRHPPLPTVSYVAIFNRPEQECITWAVSVRQSTSLDQMFARSLPIGQLRQHEPRWRRGNVREIDLLAREAIAGPVPLGLFMKELNCVWAFKLPAHRNTLKNLANCVSCFRCWMKHLIQYMIHDPNTSVTTADQNYENLYFMWYTKWWTGPCVR